MDTRLPPRKRKAWSFQPSSTSKRGKAASGEAHAPSDRYLPPRKRKSYFISFVPQKGSVDKDTKTIPDTLGAEEDRGDRENSGTEFASGISEPQPSNRKRGRSPSPKPGLSLSEKSTCKLEIRPSKRPRSPSESISEGDEIKEPTARAVVLDNSALVSTVDESAVQTASHEAKSATEADDGPGGAPTEVLDPAEASDPTLNGAPSAGPVLSLTAAPAAVPSAAKDARPFRCPQCPARFRAQYRLNSHRRHVHLRERRFRCPREECSFGATSQHALNLHEAGVHLGERRYACRVLDCEKRFVQLSHRNRHERNMHRLDLRNRRDGGGQAGGSGRHEPPRTQETT